MCYVYKKISIKRFFYSTFFFLLFFTESNAQPTLTYAGNGPQAGQSFTYYQSTTPPSSPGSSGANQTWDFSSVSTTGVIGTVSWVVPSETPYGDDFPSAAVAFDFLGNYEYVTSNSLGYSEIGIENSIDKGIFTDAQIQGVFPFTYQNSFSDSFALIITSAGQINYAVGSGTVVADAYGNLMTPFGNYQNVLREKLYNTQIDSIVLEGSTEITRIDQAIYLYFAQGDSYPVMDITFDTSFGVGTTTLCSFAVPVTEGVNPVSLFEQNLHLFPNPADKKTSLQLSLQEPGSASLSICNIWAPPLKHFKLHIYL